MTWFEEGILNEREKLLIQLAWVELLRTYVLHPKESVLSSSPRSSLPSQYAGASSDLKVSCGSLTPQMRESPGPR